MKKYILLFVFAVTAFIELSAQQKSVSGKVTDEKGLPVVGAPAIFKVGKIGITTKEDGSFVLNVITSAKCLLFSYPWYAEEEVATGNRSVINLTV